MPINTVAKKLFDPLKNTRTAPKTQGLIDAMYPSCKDSTIFKYMYMDDDVENCTVTPSYPPEEDFNLGTELEIETTENLPVPPSLSKLAADKESVDDFINFLPTYTQEDVKSIENLTRG